MSLYNVVRPCVVAGRHHVRPATAIEIDDDVAAPLVEAGDLEPFGSTPAESGAVLAGIKRTLADLGGEFAEAGQVAADEFTAGIAEPEVEKPAPRPRGRRKDAED